MIKKKGYNKYCFLVILLVLALLLSACQPEDPDQGDLNNQKEIDPPDIIEPETDNEDVADDFDRVDDEADVGDNQCRLIPEGLCYYPYFPAIEGYTQTYNVFTSTTGQVQPQIRKIGEVQTGIGQPGEPNMDGFNLYLYDAEVDAVIDISCVSEGMIVNDLQGLMESMLEGMESAGEQFETVSIDFEGVTHANDVSPGDSWESVLKWVMRPATSPEDIYFIITNQFTFVGYETVTVPAGTFEARRIDTSNDVSFGVMTQGGFFPISTFTSTSKTWSAECIGLVKSVGEALGIETVVELYEYALP